MPRPWNRTSAPAGSRGGGALEVGEPVGAHGGAGYAVRWRPWRHLHLDVLRVFVGPGRRAAATRWVSSSSPARSVTRVRAADRRRPRLQRDGLRVRPRRARACGSSRPSLELPLAGHPLVGTSWLLHREGPAPTVLRPPAGDVPTWQDADLTWIRARSRGRAGLRPRRARRRPRRSRRSTGLARRRRQDGRLGLDRRGGRDHARAGVPSRLRHPGGRGHRRRRAAPVRAAGRPIEIRQGSASVLARPPCRATARSPSAAASRRSSSGPTTPS